MKNSPYLNQDRELDVLLKLVRDYDAKTRRFTRLPSVTRPNALLGGGVHERVVVEAEKAAVARRGTPLKRVS